MTSGTSARVELIACETCGSAEADALPSGPNLAAGPSDRPASKGERLIAELRAALATAGQLDFELLVSSVRCLWSCTRSCAVHLRGAGRVGYVLCDLTPDQTSAQALIEYARLYAQSSDGLVPLRTRPQALRGHFLCRIPAISP